ncbi:hypothetical protein LJR219_000206 [Phenylobacterium sp. LjRoot219]|uniref:hypothetical protein n=1 Tax=Phenylobacterium sp. LjRoot219 TaxID=3342283 RepID=UPI003ECC83AB
MTYIREVLGTPTEEAAQAEEALDPDWDDDTKLLESGLALGAIDEDARSGRRYLHIDVAASPAGQRARELFLGLTGLSDKQQRTLFPALRSRSRVDRERLSTEVTRLNAWLDEVRVDGFDPAAFVTYQRSIGIHGQTTNWFGRIGAAGAACAFADAIEELQPNSISDAVGLLPPPSIRKPIELYNWLRGGADRTVRALLLRNGRAIVFAGSKDVNIFEPLGGRVFSTAQEALTEYNAVATNQRARSQRLHEHSVGEVKTATDPANLHERMGLASRETQTELRTDRFLFMALLSADILAGGTQRRTLNNRDLTRFSHVFNLHHCWGWDGGRDRHPNHWSFFKASVAEWCGL